MSEYQILLEEIVLKNEPSDSRDENCGACERLEVHGVCLLRRTVSTADRQTREAHNLQPILAVDIKGGFCWLPCRSNLIYKNCYSIRLFP